MPRPTPLLVLALTACSTPGTNADPVVTIVAPEDGSRPPEGQPIPFRIDLDDPEDALVRVTVRSDLDGVLHRSDALPVPQTYAVDVLVPTVARHVLTVTAIDPDGGRATATVTVDVNAAPSAPGITVEPAAPVEGEALVATVTTLSRDASPLGYAWTWSRDDTPVDSGDGRRAEVAAGTTRAGEVWRASFEAYEKRGDARDPEGGSSFGEATVTIGEGP